VLEVPEREYASEYEAPRRRAVAPNRKLRRDFTEDFSDDFLEDEDALPTRKRGGVRLKFRGGLPRTKWGRIVAGLMVVALLGICIAGLMAARSALLHDQRFVISSASSIEFAGNVHATREQLLDVFGEDVERNIFYVPLAQRQAELQRLPWVAHASVMRLLPNRLRVSVVERTPVAFVRQGSHIGLVDANGVLLDMPPGAQGDAHYSFPVVTGISTGDPLSTRAARMKIFEGFTSDLDSGGDKISQGLSEVDLSNPEDVKALIPTDSTDILVHFGEANFLERYKKFEEHLPEWRTQYPRLASVDMRYESQAVLEMEPESSAAQGANSSTQIGATQNSAGASPVAAIKAAAVTATSTRPPAKTAVHAIVKAMTHAPARHEAKGHPAKTHAATVKGKHATKVPAHSKAVNEVAFAVPAKKRGGKATSHVVKAHRSTARHSASVKKNHSSQAVHP
jgi:cell division protein FtsQ